MTKVKTLILHNERTKKQEIHPLFLEDYLDFPNEVSEKIKIRVQI
jgi:hypothetical protein